MGDGFFYPPTVIADIHPDSEILTTEVFGPVAPITVFDDVEDAIRLANADRVRPRRLCLHR